MSIQVRHIEKRFGQFVALDDVTLDFPAGALTALLGPSGCGKTTLLRIIAGLEAADRGQVLFDGEDASQRPARERQIGFVFQHYALFRHMNVFENVAFGLRVKPRKLRPDPAQIRRRVNTLLELVQMGELAERHPAQLSGGQRQRIALARALAVEPRVLLLDEPFGALDAQVRKDLRGWLRRLHEELRVTSIFVTHDQEEALEVADQVVLMQRGRIEQQGTPEALYHHPVSPFVAGFLGEVNQFHGKVAAGVLASDAGNIAVPADAPRFEGPGVAYVRPQELALSRCQPGEAGIAARLRRVHAIGALTKVELERCDSRQRIDAVMSQDQYAALQLDIGETVLVRPTRLRLFAHPGT
ncbi:MAG: sulfate ABC transporter ATP-binding protein [Pseudomonadota bacterium]